MLTDKSHLSCIRTRFEFIEILYTKCGLTWTYVWLYVVVSEYHPETGSSLCNKQLSYIHMCLVPLCDDDT